jgi:hypothetical protein
MIGPDCLNELGPSTEFIGVTILARFALLGEEADKGGEGEGEEVI